LFGRERKTRFKKLEEKNILRGKRKKESGRRKRRVGDKYIYEKRGRNESAVETNQKMKNIQVQISLECQETTI